MTIEIPTPEELAAGEEAAKPTWAEIEALAKADESSENLRALQAEIIRERPWYGEMDAAMILHRMLTGEGDVVEP